MSGVLNGSIHHHIASFGAIAKVVAPTIIGCTGFWFWYRTVYGWTHTMNDEWYEAEGKMMNAMPCQAGPPIRINPFSDKQAKMAIHQLASASKVLSVLLLVCAASAAIYYYQRHMWPLERTLNNDWFVASEKYMEQMPREASSTPVRMNPWSKKINMHSVTY